MPHKRNPELCGHLCRSGAIVYLVQLVFVRPGGLPGGAERDVLGRARGPHRQRRRRRGRAAHGRAAGPAADQQRPGAGDAGASASTASASEQSSASTAARARSRRGRVRRSARAARRWPPAGSASARRRGRAAASARRRRVRAASASRQAVVVDAEQSAPHGEDPRGVERADQRQVAAGGVGEAGDQPVGSAAGVVGDANAVPEVPIETTTSPGQPRPSAAAMLSPVPGASAQPAGASAPTTSAGAASRGSRGGRGRARACGSSGSQRRSAGEK